MSQNNGRDSRFELVRLIAILMVVLSHFSTYDLSTRFTTDADLSSRIGMYFFVPFSKVGVTLFVLITGYFLANKIISPFSAFQRSWKVWSEVSFYSIMLGVAFLLCGLPISPMNLIQSLLPFSTVEYWFVSSYILLMLLLPLINTAIQKMPKTSFQFIVIVMLLVDCFLPLLSKNLEFRVLSPYLIGAYIKIYGINVRHKSWYLISLIVISYVFMIILNYIHPSATMALTTGIIPRLIGILIFLMVLDHRAFHSRTINTLATTAFAGFIITEYPPMRALLWNKILAFESINSILLANILGVLAILVILYVIIFVIDLARQKLFEIAHVDSFPAFLNRHVFEKYRLFNFMR